GAVAAGQHQIRKESAVIQLGGVVGDTDVVAPQGDGRITRSQAVMHVVEVPDQLGVLPLLRGDGGALGPVGGVHTLAAPLSLMRGQTAPDGANLSVPVDAMW